MIDRFFRQNVYWLLLVIALVAALVYQSTRPPRVVPASRPFIPQDVSVLDRPVAGQFHQVSLRQLLATLSKEIGQPIYLETPYYSLTNPDMPVNFEVQDPIPLWQALDLLCVQLAWSPGTSIATYVVAGSSVILTTNQYLACQYATTVLYDVHDLLKFSGKFAYYDMFDELSRKIQENCAPGTWNDTLGVPVGEISECNNGRLVIRNTAQAHRHIENFLAALRK